MADDIAKFGVNLHTVSELAGSERALTEQVWFDLDRHRAMFDPNYGFFHLERGQSGVGAFTSTQATAGTALWIASGQTGFGPVLELDSNSTTNTQGIQVQYPGLGVNPKDGMTIYGEWMARALDIATAPEAYLGLATLDTTVIASGSMSASDWIGFYGVGGSLAFGVEDGSQDISATATHTLVDGDTTTDGSEWFRGAFRWKVGESFLVYINRVKQDVSDVSIANEPDGPMVVTGVCQSNGTTDPIIHVAQFAFGYKF